MTIPHLGIDKKLDFNSRNLVDQKGIQARKKNLLSPIKEVDEKKSEEIKKSLKKSHNFVEPKNDFSVEFEDNRLN